MRIIIRLKSDTTFGRGDGVIGMVDSEIEHDKATGLPIIKGRTVKGLLVEACADLLHSLETIVPTLAADMTGAAGRLFGTPGSTTSNTGRLHIGQGTLPPSLVSKIQQGNFPAHEVLQAMTTIRSQTAVKPTTNTPQRESLRATRAVIRETVFVVPLTFTDTVEDIDCELLAACVATVRRAGQNRTRGTGHIACMLDTDVDYLQRFTQRVEGAS